MKIKKEKLDLKNGLEREWIISNGIGGYASQTVIGANTRKYHGLLVAPLDPPSRRYVLLSKVDESITIDGVEKKLYTNVCKNYISQGYKNLKYFEKEYIPKFVYEIDGISIEKQICMVHMRNTVCVTYDIKNANKDILLKIAPIMNYRDFHRMNTNHNYTLNQQIKDKKVRVTIDGNKTMPIYMHMNDGNYIEHFNDTFKNMYYIEEEKRGFYPEEDLVVTGRYEIFIKANEHKKLTFVCSLESNIEEIDGFEVIKNEIKRLEKLIDNSELITKKSNSKNEILKDLVIASDLFITYRQKFSLHTIIAGFPWFLDWGRDALISFEGLTLVTKRFDLAKEILLMFTRDIKFGLIPNGYSGYDSRPLYNSVDSSLLLFEQINKYIKYTNDFEFIRINLYDILKNIVKMFSEGINIDNSNIYLDTDGLISAGTEDTQLTWMDAKVNNIAVTPRNGKSVEINAMWYNALKTLEDLAKKFDDNDTKELCSKLSKKAKLSFNKKFYNEKKKCLYDVLGDDKVRPNQLFALSLTYPVVNTNSEKAIEIIDIVSKELVTKYGLATLSKKDKNYVAIYEGDSFKRDSSYHQGITWPWLIGLYIDALKNVIKGEKDKDIKDKLQNKLNKYISDTQKTFKKSIYEDGCVGNISELYDSKSPYGSKGTIAQAWSVSEILKLMIEE